MSHLLIVEPLLAGLHLIPAAKKAGHRVSVLSADTGERTLPPECAEQTDRHLKIDGYDEDAALTAACALHAQDPLDAVLPGFEYFVPLAARIADQLGLPGIGAEHALQLRHKHLMRAALEQAGVPAPGSRLVTTTHRDVPQQVAAALETTSLPCVVKPVDMAQSQFVRRADTYEQALAAVEAIATAPEGHVNHRTQPLALIEEYIPGPEYSIEGCSAHGRTEIFSITKKLLGPEPFFVETGHLVNVPLPPEQRRSLTDYVSAGAAALGLTCGVFHAEVRIGPSGPRLMEIAARLPGDQICTLIHLASGVDLPSVFIDCQLGAAPPAGHPPAARFAGIRFLTRPGLTRFETVTGLEKARELPGFVTAQLLYPPGSDLPAAEDFSSRLGWLIYQSQDFPTLEHTLDDADRAIAFH